MKRAKQTGHYDSYLLRIWRGNSQNQWRWMLQNIRTGEHKGFRDLHALVQFLDAEYGETQGAWKVETRDWSLEIGD